MRRRVRSCALLLSALALLLMTIFIPSSPVAAAVALTTTEEVTLTLDALHLQTYYRPNHPSVESDVYLPAEDDYDWDDILLYNDPDEGYPTNDSTLYHYNALTLSVTVSGLHTIEVTEDNWTEGNTGDTMLWLYAGSFQAGSPLTNVWVVNDNGGNYEHAKLMVDLTFGELYTLVVTALPATTEGAVTISITSPAAPKDNGEEQQSDPGDESPDDPGDEAQDEASSTPSATSPTSPVKRDPITILHSATGVRTEDLSYLAAIPEQWMSDVTYVEFWIDAAPVADDSPRQTAIDVAAAALKVAGRTLYETQDVTLMSRVTWRDRHQVTSPIDPSCIRGNIPVYLEIPAELIDREALGIVYIDETGAVAFLESERVMIEGTVYLRFENNALPAVYSWVG
jgi:hypothetical protein